MHTETLHTANRTGWLSLVLRLTGIPDALRKQNAQASIRTLGVHMAYIYFKKRKANYPSCSMACAASMLLSQSPKKANTPTSAWLLHDCPHRLPF